MPWGILGSLAICTVLYILFAHVMTGVTSYTTFAGQRWYSTGCLLPLNRWEQPTQAALFNLIIPG
jgi:amino acid transporter